MTSLLHDTSLGDAWSQEVVPLLPPDLAERAVALGAYQRLRAFASASDLLRGLLAYAITANSFRHLGAWAVLQEVAELAPSSWFERLRASTSWLQWLTGSLLQRPRPTWLSQLPRGRVLLVDATALRWQGGTGDDLRLHLAFDLLAGQLAQLVLTDHHSAEHVQHFGLQAGDLYVLDGGYGYRDRLARIQQAQADGLMRIYPPTFPLETANGQRLDVRAWLDSLKSGQGSRLAYYRQAGQQRAVRVLALRHPEAQRQIALRRAQERARKRQRPLHPVTQYFADWVVLVTTLLDEESWPEQALWRLYAARWQVELLIKRQKQLLQLGKLRCRTIESGIPLVYAILVAWLLHEPQLASLRASLQSLALPHPATLPGQAPSAEAVVSMWGVSNLLLETLRQAIRGTWSFARVQECLPRLRRYLVSHPCLGREHQATEVVAWLSGVRRTRHAALLDAE